MSFNEHHEGTAMLELFSRRSYRYPFGMCPSRGRGFTLIELMVVVAIIAIVAMIALPSYSRYAYRTRRADGKNMLMTVAAAQERFYTNYNRYGTMSDLNYPSGLSEKGYYNVTSANGTTGDSQSYLLTATPQGVQQNDSCAELTVTESGLKRAPHDSHANGACW